jgi:hypothetical protein
VQPEKKNSSMKNNNLRVKKSTFFHAQATFFHACIPFFHAGEKAGFGCSAVEGSLINLLRNLYGQGYGSYHVLNLCEVQNESSSEPTPSTLTLVAEKSLTRPLPLHEIRA